MKYNYKLRLFAMCLALVSIISSALLFTAWNMEYVGEKQNKKIEIQIGNKQTVKLGFDDIQGSQAALVPSGVAGDDDTLTDTLLFQFTIVWGTQDLDLDGILTFSFESLMLDETDLSNDVSFLIADTPPQSHTDGKLFNITLYAKDDFGTSEFEYEGNYYGTNGDIAIESGEDIPVSLLITMNMPSDQSVYDTLAGQTLDLEIGILARTTHQYQADTTI